MQRWCWIQGCEGLFDCNADTTLAESVRTIIGRSDGVVAAKYTAAASAENIEQSGGRLRLTEILAPKTPRPTPLMEREPSVYL